jgi:rod shape-determining protein MreD
MIEAVKNIFRFAILILLQVTVIRHLDLGQFLNPMIYVAAILMLPIQTPKALVMFIAFFCGFIIDMFYHTPGINTAACVFMAFCRPRILKIFAPREDYESSSLPNVQSMGMIWMLSYTGTLVLLHHFVLFYTEAFTLSYFFSTFLKALLSSLATVTLILLSQYLTLKRANG